MPGARRPDMRIVYPACLMVFAAASLAVLTRLRAQEAAGVAPRVRPRPEAQSTNPSQMLGAYSVSRQMFLQSALRGGEWLSRVNGPDGQLLRACVLGCTSTAHADNRLGRHHGAFALARVARV